ncbi:MAG: hypothetical protein ABEK04_01640, partial [Candidatus Nanohalobium sp.]
SATQEVLRDADCGEVKEQNILPMKHAVLGCAYKINQESECCDNPEYTDNIGYVEDMNKSPWRFLPRMAP